MLASITQSGANGIGRLPNGEASWFRPSLISDASLFLSNRSYPVPVTFHGGLYLQTIGITILDN